MLNQNKECRICFENEEEDNRFISPCLCSGTSKYVHYKCLERWRFTNIHSDAFVKCKECNEPYKIKKTFPDEQINIYNHFRSTLVFHALFYSIMFISSLLIWFLDQMNNSALVEILNFNQTHTLIHPTIINYIEQDFFFALAFYFSYTSMIFTYLFYLYFILNIFSKIKRKKIYIKNIYPYLLSGCLYNTLFFLLYYLFVFTNIPSIALNVIFCLEISQPIVMCKVIQKHNVYILIMNIDNMNIVLNYYEEDNIDIEEGSTLYIYNEIYAGEKEDYTDSNLEIEIKEFD